MTPAQYYKCKMAQAEKYRAMAGDEKEYYRQFAAARVMASRLGLTINKLSKKEKYFVINTADNFTKYFDDLASAVEWIKAFSAANFGKN